jgi:hypothetical protein
MKPDWFTVEYTDTFGGEANYSWVHRAEIQVKAGASRSQVMRAAKAALGLTNVRGVTYGHGDMYEFRPYKSCTVLFVYESSGVYEEAFT